MSIKLAGCPRGHEHARIIRDGIQGGGGRQNQRWHRVPPGGSYHRFLGSMSRTRVTDATCVECENRIAPDPASQVDMREARARGAPGTGVTVSSGR